MKKRVLSILLGTAFAVSLVGCGSSSSTSTTTAASSDTTTAASSDTTTAAAETTTAASGSSDGTTAKVNIAYQYGLAYAPLIIAQDQSLIEEAYKEATGNDIEVTWTQMSSGADINTGIASGDINFGFMGVAPAITGVASNVGYKICMGLSGQEHALMTNDENIKSLGDLVGSDSQIALVNIGSIQHIILAEALVANGYDAHALDSNLVAMKHPDGKTSLETGSVACQLTTNPYIYLEREEDGLHELTEVSDIWTSENSFIVGVASESIYNDQKDVYDAVCTAISEAVDYVNENPEETAKLTCEYDGNTEEDEVTYLGYGTYSVETKGVYDLAKFMYENDFVENDFSDFSELAFDNVVGD